MGSELQEAAFFLDITRLKKKNIWKLDLDGNITRVAPSLVSASGYSEGELSGMSLGNLLSPESRKLLSGIHESRMAGEADGIKTGIISMELELICKEGRISRMEFLTTPERDDDGKICGFFVFSRELEGNPRRPEIPEARELFELFMSHFPGLAYIKETDGTIVFANEGFRSGLGLDPLSVIGKHTDELFPPGMAETMMEDDRKVLETGEQLVREEDVAGRIWMTRKFRIVRKTGSPLLGGLTYDITDRINSQRAVRNSEERLNRAELAAGFGNWEFHLDDGTVFASEGARRLYGLGGSDWNITDVQKIPLPQYREALDAAMSGLINEGKPYDVEFQIKKPSDGSQVAIHSIARYDRETNIIFGVIQDISARKAAEDAFIRKSEELNKFFFTSLDLFCIADMEGHFLNLNPEWGRTLGYPVDSMIGKVFLDYVHPDDLDGTIASIGELGKNREVINFINRYRCADGSYRWIEWRSTPANGLIYAAARDITERKMHEEALKEARQKAEEADRLKSAFLANISHEIRTPMNGIIGFAEMLKDPDITEGERGEFVRIINDSSVQLLNIVNDVLDISRIEVGEIELNFSVIPVAELLGEMTLMFKPLVDRKGLSLLTDNRIPEPCQFLNTDPVKLRQVLNNLLGNALKFTLSGSITLGCRESRPGELVFFIRDTGPGIPFEMQDMIFERFHQLEQKGSGVTGGTGLGLPIARALVRLLGGELSLTSVPGKGSEFYFSIPCGQIENLPAHSFTVLENSYTPGGLLLVVEDEEMNWQYISAVLKGGGYRVVRADSGQNALELFKSEKPDLILVDIKLPDISGLEVARQIRLSNGEIPLVALTAYAFETDREKALAAGCNDYLAKPVRRDLLLETVARNLRQRS